MSKDTKALAVIKGYTEEEARVYAFCRRMGDTRTQAMRAVAIYKKPREGYEYYRNAYEN